MILIIWISRIKMKLLKSKVIFIMKLNIWNDDNKQLVQIMEINK